MSTERDELAELIARAELGGDDNGLSRCAADGETPIYHSDEHAADAILAAGYRRIDHTEYALDHKLADLQFTDDDGELWADEDDVKDYASEYGDTAPLVKRHVTAWEAAQ